MAVLTTKQRKALAKSDFAIPAAGGGGSYPIPDIAHARNALARVAQFGTSAEQAQVRAAVHRKFPQIRFGSQAEQSMRHSSRRAALAKQIKGA